MFCYFPRLTGKIPKIDNLNDLIQALRIVFEDDNVNIELVNGLMKAYKSNPLDWKKFAKFDKFRYTRNLVDEGNGKYNLMLLCWDVAQGSAIHDHSNAHCFMKVIYGALDEVRFAWPEGGRPLAELSRNRLPSDAVCYINDSLGLHRVENPSSSDVAVSLHLYCPPFDECSIFNQQTGKRTVCKVTFWSKYGKRPDRKHQDDRPPEDN